MTRALLLLLTAALAYPSSDPRDGQRRLYFLAATSTWNRTDAFPANLYEIENGKLKLIKEIVPSSEGVNFIRRYDGVLTIGSPHITPTRLYLVDARNEILSISSTPIGVDGSTLTETLFVDPPRLGLSQALELTSGNTAGPIKQSSEVITLSSPLRQSDLVKSAPWSVWADLRMTGSTAGPQEQGASASCTIRNGQIGYPSPVGLIRLVPSADGPRAGKEDYCTVSGSNERFLIYIRLVGSIGELAAAKEKTFEVYDRATRRTTPVIVQGSFSRVTLYGDWLVITTVEPNFDHRPNPGIDAHSQQGGTALSPPIQDLFAHNEPPQYFPGICVLRNLATGDAITLNTGQADTEILGVLGNTVVYRINKQLISGRLGKDAIADSKVIAEDVNVTAIHWMLPGK